MKAESTIRKTMNKLFQEGKEEGNAERSIMAYDMATALQWVLGNMSGNPASLLDFCCGENKVETNG